MQAGSKPAEAIGLLERAVAADPNWPDVHERLALAYLSLGRRDESLIHLRKAVSLDPQSARAQSNLSGLLGQMGMYRDAEQAARRALSQDPSCDQARYFLALALFARWEGTQEALKNFRAVAPSYPAAHAAASQILHKLGRANDFRAEADAYIAEKDRRVTPSVRACR